jgi:SAM-dependent methyltransferase
MTDCPVCHTAARPHGKVGDYPLWRCLACGTEFLHPQPDDAALSRIYGQHYYDAWGVKDAESAVRELKLATFRQRLDCTSPWLKTGGSVLDVGCATGYFLEAAREAGFQPFGVELSEYGAACCREKFGAGRIHAGTLEDAHFADLPDARFDAIFMSDLLEHVRDPRRTLAQAAALLAPQGCLVITTPHARGALHTLMRRHWLHYKPEHLYYFTPAALCALLGEAGLADTRRLPAQKVLSLRYARHQSSLYGRSGQIMGWWLNRLPDSLLDAPLRVTLGEFTLLARRGA